MEDQLPFRLTVFDKAFVRRGTIGAVESLSVAVRRNAAGDAVFVLPADHRRVPDLLADGARCTVHYRWSPSSDELYLLSGRVVERTGAGSTVAATRTFQVIDDFSLFGEVLGWPVPDGSLTGQNVEYHRVRGPAETVVKTIAGANFSRLGLPVTVPASSGRGATIDVSIRFHPLLERLFPAADQAGVVVQLRQEGAGLLLDVREPATYPRTLTEESGVVEDGEFTLKAPTATRVVIGAHGEGTARYFYRKIDSALEAAWGAAGKPFVVERFVDARDVENDGNRTQRLEARADEALAEGAPKATLKARLAETDAFRFGKTFDVGDEVAVQLAGAPVLTDVVREVQLEWSQGSGMTVTPLVGEWSDSTLDVALQYVGRALRGVRNLEVGR